MTGGAPYKPKIVGRFLRFFCNLIFVSCLGHGIVHQSVCCTNKKNRRGRLFGLKQFRNDGGVPYVQYIRGGLSWVASGSVGFSRRE